MTLLQITETMTMAANAASKEDRPFVLLFMLAIFIVVCYSWYMIYRDSKKEREANNEAREKSEIRQVEASNTLAKAMQELSSTCRDISKDLSDVKVSVNNLNNFVREK